MKTTRAITKARRYAAGGALPKADLGDFRQNDPLRSIVRAVRDQYFAGNSYADPRNRNVTEAIRTPAPEPDAPGSNLPAIWGSVMEGGATPRATPSNTAAKGDRRAMNPPVSELDSFAWLGPVDQAAAPRTAPADPAQAALNSSRNRRELLSIIPGPGNVIAAQDAIHSGGEAARDIGEGRYKSAALNGALALLSGAGAATGLPFGRLASSATKGASSRTNVFVPAENDNLSAVARALRDQPAKHFNRLGGQNQTIHRETGRVFGADGVLRREIPDTKMRKTQREWSHGDEAPLKDVVDHPELWAQRPDKGNIPVKFEKLNEGKTPFARTSGDSFQLSNQFRHKWLRANVAKLLQYNLSKEGNLAAPLRHDINGTLKHIDNTMGALAEGVRTEKLPVAAALQYLNRLQAEKDDIAKFVADAQGNLTTWKHPWLRAKDLEPGAVLSPKDLRHTINRGVNARNAGNIESDIVKKRVTVPEGYPYEGAPPFAEQLVLPHSLDMEKLGDFVTNWHRYGSGRPKFAQGGKVAGAIKRARKQLTSGSLTGDTTGRSDKLPVKASEGSYVIPADVVSALGEGNSAAGHKILFGRFPGGLGKGVRKPRLARGGAVDIIVSDGEFIITPEDAAALGGGDLSYGHEILDAFVLNTRKDHIKTLSTLPGPKK